MKFKFIKKLLLLPFILGILPLGSCSKNENKLIIAEVTHSVFYAPMYVAKNKGYFDEVGLEVDIITTPGADKVMAALLSKDAQIGLMGISLQRWENFKNPFHHNKRYPYHYGNTINQQLYFF